MSHQTSSKLPPVAILAGGLAKRLRPITETIPKALVEVNGRPFILHQIEQLKKEGITDIVCCVGYKGEMIEDVLGDGSRFGVHVSYSFDGEKLLGTGGAIKKALKKLGSEFYILYGDSYLQVSYKEVKEKFDASQKKGVLTIMENKGAWDTSNLHYQDDHIIAYSKKNITPQMTYIDYGLSLLKADVFNIYADDQVFDLGDVYEQMAKDGELAALKVYKRFYEIGSHTGLQELEAHMNRQAP